MTRWMCIFLSLTCAGCGYKMVAWSSANYRTVEVLPVQALGTGEAHELRFRLRDALMTRFLSNSGLKPVVQDADLVLSTNLTNVGQETLATGTDGRTERLQLTVVASFKLLDAQGQELWQLENYRYTEQIPVATTTQSYTDETVRVQEAAMSAIADLVVRNVSLVISELAESK